MNVLAFKTSGDSTSVSIIFEDEINSFSMTHARKDRPNWDMFLKNVGYNKRFCLDDIDLFAYANSQNSYTATRSVASYLKGIAVALNKPLIVVEDNDIENIDSDWVAKLAKNIYLSSDSDKQKFNPSQGNPRYFEANNFKKLNE